MKTVKPLVVQENVPLAPLTTLRIGGLARYSIHADSENTVLGALDFAEKSHLPVLVLGGGSNVLIADSGFPGVVLHVAITGVQWESDRGGVAVRAGAGEDWDELVAAAVARNLGGIECLSGIPGRVGGTPVQNVGAYGQEVSEVLTEVRGIDRATGRVREFTKAECGFGYRSSLFNGPARDQYVLTRATYRLRTDAEASVKYPDIAKVFALQVTPPSLAEVRNAVRQVRASKSMLLVEGDPDCRSAGSFFKNPVVSEETLARIQDVAIRADMLGAGERVPSFAAENGLKTSAAWLIDRAGFRRGYRKGAAGISTKHTLALVNRGDARATDILDLAREIRSRVRDVFGITLVPEPVLIGFGEEIDAEFSR